MAEATFLRNRDRAAGGIPDISAGCWRPAGSQRLKGDELISGPEEKSAATAKRIAELQEQIADLKRRMPAHTPRASMITELEELEEELERLQRS